MRLAVRDDLPTLERVGLRACLDAFAGLVPQAVALAEHRRLLPPGRLKELLLARNVLVGVGADGRIEAFALVVEDEGLVDLRTVVAPSHPSRPLTAAPFVEALRARGWVGPVTSEVVLGNVVHEEFLEAAGFSPGEVWDDEVEGHAVIRRRWWLPGRSERIAG